MGSRVWFATFTAPTSTSRCQRGRAWHEQQEDNAKLIRLRRQQAEESEPDDPAFTATEG
jgi:hypothetical protein